VNKDLADVLGNFVSRVTKFCAARFDGKVPAGGEWSTEENTLSAALDNHILQYGKFLEEMEFRKALGELRTIWVLGNEYLTRAAPWTAIKQNRDAAAVSVRVGLNLVHLFAHLAWPVMPSSAVKIHATVDDVGDVMLPWPDPLPAKEYLQGLKVGSTVNPPDILFAKVEEEKVKAWEARFGGAQ